MEECGTYGKETSPRIALIVALIYDYTFHYRLGKLEKWRER